MSGQNLNLCYTSTSYLWLWGYSELTSGCNTFSSYLEKKKRLKKIWEPVSDLWTKHDPGGAESYLSGTFFN